jgi:diguanylate cyclase (GGDEF)-like protein
MLPNAQALMRSPRRLVAAILLFVALDLVVLLINLSIAQQVAEDAVAINLAGRQRMLSQRMTKAAVLATRAADPQDAPSARQELFEAYDLFAQTLAAFARGGPTEGSDGATVRLEALTGAPAAIIIRAQRLLAPVDGPMREAMQRREASLAPVAQSLITSNQEILVLMNDLTTDLERDSIRRTQALRIIQTAAFVLALVNFLAIVHTMTRRFQAAEREKAHWQDMARHDALTGLANRKGFFEAADRILARARRDGDPGALILLDLDGFKPINDRLGHPVGDLVLRQFADHVRAIARQTDVVARLGGDEFVLLCPGLHGEADIAQVCIRIVDAVTTIPPARASWHGFGVSIGVATFPDDGYEIDALIAGADHAMYAAKRDGGNRWSLR